jgi:hypothetical protein
MVVNHAIVSRISHPLAFKWRNSHKLGPAGTESGSAPGPGLGLEISSTPGREFRRATAARALFFFGMKPTRKPENGKERGKRAAVGAQENLGGHVPQVIARRIGAAALRRSYVVDHVPRAGARGRPGRGARMRLLECALGGLAPLDFAVLGVLARRAAGRWLVCGGAA